VAGAVDMGTAIEGTGRGEGGAGESGRRVGDLVAGDEVIAGGASEAKSGA
jgi:hypothetical protein